MAGFLKDDNKDEQEEARQRDQEGEFQVEGMAYSKAWGSKAQDSGNYQLIVPCSCWQSPFFPYRMGESGGKQYYQLFNLFISYIHP